jgi:2-methylisocitrate lyase-like PEP mutase family enzyme
VRAASEAAHALPFSFTLTARAENFLYGRTDLADTIRRLQAFQEAGADVLYAPGLSRLEDIEAVVRSVNRPVNVLALAHLDRASLETIGVRASAWAARWRARLMALCCAPPRRCARRERSPTLPRP